MPTMLSVNVGMPKDVSWQGRTVHTGVWKFPVHGPARVRRLDIDGDGQGDTNGHGGEQRTVLVYQIQSYRHWQQYFGRDELGFGRFGEDLTVDGLLDDEVGIGDRYRIGETEFEVIQPRVTCYRVGLGLGEPELPALLVSHHRPGFYMRVIHEGHIQAGDPIVQTRTGPGALSVADTDALLHLPDPEPAKLRLALRIPAFSPGWQDPFRDLPKSVDGRAVVAATGPAWNGFRPLRVAEVFPESTAVTSIHLAASDGSLLPAAHAGQYLTLRIPEAGRPAPVRSYSLSSTPDVGRYRSSVKHEPHGTASVHLITQRRPGAILDAAAPRDAFLLDDGTGPVLLISTGIGLTPVLSMLHELAARDSDREIWWIYGGRRLQEHPLVAETHALPTSLPNTHEHVFYSTSTPEERRRTRAADGRLTKDKPVALSVPADATAYSADPPPSWPTCSTPSPRPASTRPVSTPSSVGAMPSINPGLTGQAARTPHQPPGPPGTGPLVTFARSGISVTFPDSRPSVLELADACDVPTRWSPHPTATCSSAVLRQASTSSSTCEAAGQHHDHTSTAAR
ncbi:MOSC domain-containing protein [Streptomyces mirabilis]|uniref:MOSC domain-containing protein n=1 Tax=Streptomyces mirabilis TaxID=68239 RepID=UPI0033B8B0F4